jgi:hypothetical protein
MEASDSGKRPMRGQGRGGTTRATHDPAKDEPAVDCTKPVTAVQFPSHGGRPCGGAGKYIWRCGCPAGERKDRRLAQVDDERRHRGPFRSTITIGAMTPRRQSGPTRLPWRFTWRLRVALLFCPCNCAAFGGQERWMRRITAANERWKAEKLKLTALP